MRRFISTLAIVMFAAGIAWLSSSAASSVTSHVKEEVERLVPRFQRDPTTIHSIVVDPILESILASSLQLVHIESVEQNLKFIVVVSDGDDKEFGDGTATHVASIRVNNKSIAQLRIICSSDTAPLRITGVWTP